ncbi:MAG: hypothetical protein N3F09_07645 [Bacteroidia bacterium]|nr:hypothetical protein [Bacteroidia bacterium]
MKTKTLLHLFIMGTMFYSLSCDETKNDEDVPPVNDSVEIMENPIISETFFQVPSPGEMLSFIKMVGGKGNKNISFLNSPENAKNYNDPFSKAINFGIYSTDLSYCSIFEIGAEAIKYFKIVKQTGDQIGVSSAVNPEVLKRIEKNLSSPDSLSVIADEIYFSSFETLENNKQGPTLALMVAGGWIESLYIATQIAKYEEGNIVIERLADQKYTLENLMEFIKKYNSDENVKKVESDFQSLLDEYNKLNETEVSSQIKKDKKINVFEGGKKLNMSKEQFEAIRSKIAEIRNKYININVTK